MLENPSNYDTQNKLRTVYITDIREALLLPSNRLGYKVLIEKMKKISEFQLGLKRISEEKHILLSLLDGLIKKDSSWKGSEVYIIQVLEFWRDIFKGFVIPSC
ncbi:hypothetical protein NST07_21015 [Paenibacillus sp. FSL L8-0340]|uniref:hypothetical protein n=1 Tax=Paenibacillus sp. FSL L8-0340 TaxID=2954685 RepID=UPI003157FA33